MTPVHILRTIGSCAVVLCLYTELMGCAKPKQQQWIHCQNRRNRRKSNLMYSFKVVSLLGKATPPALWPLVQHHPVVLLNTHKSQLFIKSIFQVLEGSKASSFESSFDSWINPKIIGGQVRTVWRVREDCPAKVGKVLACQEGSMWRGIVHVQKSASLGCPSWPAVLEGDVEPCDDLSEAQLVDGEGAMHKFMIN